MVTYQKHPRVEQKFNSLFRVYYSGEIYLTDVDAASHGRFARRNEGGACPHLKLSHRVLTDTRPGFVD